MDLKEKKMKSIDLEENDIEDMALEESNIEDMDLEENDIEDIDLEEQESELAEAGKAAAETGMPPHKIILQVDEQGDEEAVDLLNVAGNMGKRWRIYVHLLVLAVCVGFLAAALSVGLQSLFGGGSYASAVVTFSFDGIDEGLDPNGGLFDVNKIKSTTVINDALSELGWESGDVEEIRVNMKLEGVIPSSVKQQISVINTVAEDAVEYYTNIEDLDYFPSQYTVTLNRCDGMSGAETKELLDAILTAYREYFMETYADTSALGAATAVLNVEAYDYMQASELIENQIETMEDYVDAKAEQAPAFRANSTGLSFSDLSSAIAAVKRLDLNNFISFVQSNNLTKDAGTQIDYFNYQIQQYNYEIQELQNQLSNVEKTIADYEKDPVIVMSSQESVTETSQTNEYYDTLLSRKLSLNKEISELNTSLNEAYGMIAALNNAQGDASEEDYAYADSLLEGLISTVENWSDLVRKTTEEYYEAELYADAYRISIPAQYSPVGSLGDLVKRMLIFGGAAALLVIICWAAAGLKAEIVRMRAG